MNVRSAFPDETRAAPPLAPQVAPSELYLSLLPAGAKDKRWALAIVAASIGVFAVLAPFATVQLPRIEAFIPAYQASLVLVELITAALFTGLYYLTRLRPLLILASGYLFSALMAAVHALSFPGLLAPGGVLGGGAQTTAWVYMLWHGTFPLFIIAYAWTKDAPPARGGVGAIVAALAGTVAIVIAFTLLTTDRHDLLPAIMAGNREASAMKVVVAFVWLVGIAALVTLWTRKTRTVLDLWLMVVLCAFLINVALGAVLNAGRFDLGFYSGRLYGLLAGGLVLVILLLEDHSLYGRLTRAYGDVATAKAKVDEYARRLEGRVEASEARYRQFLEQAADAIFVIDDGGQIVVANPAAERLLARSGGDIRAHRLAEFVANEDAGRVDLAQLRRHKVGTIGALTMLGRGSRRVEVEATSSQVLFEGTTFFVVIARDVSERTQLQTQLHQAQKMEAIGQLTGGLAHDFNNLLTVIVGNLELLTDGGGVDPAARELATCARRAAERGADLTHKLLAFARRQALQAKPVNINNVVDGIADLLARTLGEQIVIRRVLDEHLWPALADAAQVESAITNLAINGRDAMTKGGQLTIETANKQLDADYAALHPDVTPGDYVMVAVSDTGTGIPPEILGRVFEPFFTTKAPGKGTGLGLAMIYGFARQSKGDAKIYSEVGQGTTVRLYLPRAAGGEAEAPATPAEVPASFSAHVLLVEDAEDVCQVASTHLRMMGCRVTEATDAADALEKVDTLADLDVVFTDVVMAGSMDGIKLAAAAREQQPRLRAMFASGFSEAAVERTAQTRAIGPLVTKPYTRQDLARALHETLRRA
ncbi:MAG: response regulator [Alphaproteobacteria bacterium]|nr:response regulator [Alphaproteobacteria bacterium]